MSEREIPFISSLTNDDVKVVVQLQQSRHRKKTGLFIIEGIRAVATAIDAQLKLEKLFCVQAVYREIKEMLAIPHNKIIIVSDQVMQKMSSATTPSGLLAVFTIPVNPEITDLGPGLVLANISDPGNMGTLIRTAVACGKRTIIIVEGADPWGPKVVQASAGTIAQAHIFQWDWKALVAAKGQFKLYGLVVNNGKHISIVDKSRALIVVGNEARGLPKEWLHECDELITLPMPGGTESLNAGVAGSIAAYMAFCSIHP